MTFRLTQAALLQQVCNRSLQWSSGTTGTPPGLCKSCTRSRRDANFSALSTVFWSVGNLRKVTVSKITLARTQLFSDWTLSVLRKCNAAVWFIIVHCLQGPSDCFEKWKQVIFLCVCPLTYKCTRIERACIVDCVKFSVWFMSFNMKHVTVSYCNLKFR